MSRAFARMIGFFLTHFCGSVTLARIERAIIGEIIARSKAAREGRQSAAQLWQPKWLIRYRIRQATKRLHRTLEGWR